MNSKQLMNHQFDLPTSTVEAKVGGSGDQFSSSLRVELETKRIILRPAQHSDLPQIYGLISDPANAYRWRYLGDLPPIEVFSNTVNENIIVQFAICSKKQPSRVHGILVCYNGDFRNGHAYIGILMGSNWHGIGLGMEAIGLFIRYLFHTWPFRKLYFETTENNFGQFSSGMGRLFEIEGRLKRHVYVDGQYCDLLLCAITRELFETVIEPKINRLIRKAKERRN